MPDAMNNPAQGIGAIDANDAADLIIDEEGDYGDDDAQVDQVDDDGAELDDSDLLDAGSDDDDDADAEESNASEVVDIEFDGKPYKVPAELKDAFLRQADYSRKTQALTEERQQAHEIARGAAEERALYANHLSRLVQQLDMQADPFRNINWQQLAETNPGEWARMREAHSDYEGRLSKAVEAQQMVQAQAEQADQQSQQQQLIWERRILAEKLPQWRDAKTRQSESAQISEILAELGFADHEIGGVMDHRSVLLSHLALDGKKYRALMAKRSKQPQASTPPRAIRGGTSQTQGKAPTVVARKALNRLAQTGRAEDAVRFLLNS